jgi:hypothetical protein
MVAYNEREQKIINHFADFKPLCGSRTKYEQYMEQIPTSFKRYKCHTCYKILDNEDLIGGKCPCCGEPHLREMCPIDHNGCGHDVTVGAVYCSVCGQPVCGVCGDHSVVVISRVTGYLSDVAGWNNAKKAELQDRVRVNLNQSNEMIRVSQTT